MLKTMRSLEHEDDDLAAPAAPEPPGAHLARRRRAQRSCLLLAAGGFGLIGLAGCGSGKSAEVAVTSCQSDANGGSPTASGTFLSHKGGEVGFTFDVVFRDGSGHEVSHQIVKIPRIGKDETQNWNATGLSFYKGEVTCTVHQVKKTDAS